jgi:histidinol-phosphatase (PHP family)
VLIRDDGAGGGGGEVKRVERAVRKRVVKWTRPRRVLAPEVYGRLVDYHVHTKLCGHAVGEPEDYVREAIARGLSEIGFADHMPLLDRRDPRISMAPDDLPQYVDMVKDLQESVSGIRVRLGIEMDYIPGRMEDIWEAASRHEFDYVYGSVHYIDEWGFNDSRNVAGYKGRDCDLLYARYFELFCEAAEQGGFDIMAHPDIIKKHGITTTLPIGRLYAEAAEALSRAGVAIEINTSGLRKTAAEIYPALPFLRACAERGVVVTLGSDAHAPREVGMDFDLALGLLEKAGIREIATFEGRARVMVSIADIMDGGAGT